MQDGWFDLQNASSLSDLCGNKFWFPGKPEQIDALLQSEANPTGFVLPPGLTWVISFDAQKPNVVARANFR